MIGNNYIHEIAKDHFEMIDDIAYFVSEKELDYNIEYANELVTGCWIEKNWNKHLNLMDEYIKRIAKRIAEKGGTIVEIGTGPGGGFMPFVLDENINASIIISDLCPTVVKEWKRFFEKEINPKNIKYAVLNTCYMPFKDETIDVVSGNGGFGNIEGDKIKALKEIYRILKQGGMYVIGDIYITKEYIEKIPVNAYNILNERFPDIFIDYYKESIDVGFKKIENITGKTWSNKNDESTLASLCRELGIYLEFSTYTRYCYKD